MCGSSDSNTSIAAAQQQHSSPPTNSSRLYTALRAQPQPAQRIQSAYPSPNEIRQRDPTHPNTKTSKTQTQVNLDSHDGGRRVWLLADHLCRTHTATNTNTRALHTQALHTQTPLLASTVAGPPGWCCDDLVCGAVIFQLFFWLSSMSQNLRHGDLSSN